MNQIKIKSKIPALLTLIFSITLLTSVLKTNNVNSESVRGFDMKKCFLRSCCKPKLGWICVTGDIDPINIKNNN